MNERLRFGMPSTAAIAGHPLHPLLVTLPIGFLVGALLTDIAFVGIQDEFWARASIWLIGGGLVTGLLAAITGLIDFLGSKQIRLLTIAWIHFIGNGAALIITGVNLSFRMDDIALSVPSGGLLLSSLVVLIFALTGWLGGELVFRHGAGVIINDQQD